MSDSALPLSRLEHLSSEVGNLCRGEPSSLIRGFENQARTLAVHCFIIITCASAYGATTGLWRTPLQALYTAAKFTLVILITTVGNAFLNGMIAQLMGMKIGFRQSVLAITASFAIASVILGSLSPVTLFITLNSPPLESAHSVLSHNMNLVSHVFIIAFAGIIGNLSLFRLLRRICGDPLTSLKVLACWLLGNAFLGCQISWIMRPFIGSPNLAVEFFRSDAFDGNFYESVWRSLNNLITN